MCQYELNGLGSLFKKTWGSTEDATLLIPVTCTKRVSKHTPRYEITKGFDEEMPTLGATSAEWWPSA